jgi:hypothetical protein
LLKKGDRIKPLQGKKAPSGKRKSSSGTKSPKPRPYGTKMIDAIGKDLNAPIVNQIFGDRVKSARRNRYISKSPASSKSDDSPEIKLKRVRVNQPKVDKAVLDKFF